jgi:UTP--glucose-1-phosphate uridylyltransferase
MKLKSVVEKPKPNDAPSRFAIGGRYVFTPTIFKYLKTQTKGVGNEIQLTDAILRLIGEEEVYAMNMNAKRYDVGNKVDYIEAIIDFALKDPILKKDVAKLLKTKG